MKKIVSLLCLFAGPALQALSIVYVHIGSKIPSHVQYTVAQAKKFNPDVPIYLIANAGALAETPVPGAIAVTCESLPASDSHNHFRAKTTLERGNNGFWIYTSERFFYLEEFVRSRNLEDVVHMENDILLYTDLQTLLPVFQANYPNAIATTFEKDFRCVPGILYIPRPEPLTKMVDFMSERAESGDADMVSIGHFKREYAGVWIDFLPIVTPEYLADYAPLRSPGGEGTAESESYAKHVEEFQSIFDAASLGIYVGGDDPAFHFARPGTINPNCVFNPSFCRIEWEKDSQGRNIPMLVYKEKRTKINNLHMTNKTLIAPFVKEELP